MVQAGKAGIGPRGFRASLLVLAALGLAACDSLPREVTRAGSALELAAPSSRQTVERDVPAPEVFSVSESGLWDGRPSLGGVWVAHPDAQDPERVTIRNTQTGTEVIGALFRRERENPGPRFQISSEAAAALGILAGQPAVIEVVALRLERVEVAPPPAAAPAEPVAAAEGAPPAPAAPAAETPVETATAAPEPAPRPSLRDLFRRTPAPTPDEPVQTAAAPPVPQGAPVDTVAITDLDAPAPEPRRSLLDIFRRAPVPEAGAAPITQTALAPAAPVAAALAPSPTPVPVVAPAPAPAPVVAAPLAATAMLAEDGTALAPVRPARLAEPAVIGPDGAQADAPAPRRSLLDIFRRSPAPEAQPDSAALIPLPEATVQPAALRAAAPAPAPAPAPARAPATGAPARPFVQVGIFAVEGNAQRTVGQMRAAGLPAEVRAGRAGERAFWRVVVGPAADGAGQADLLARARGLGFADAYAVAR